MAAEEMFISSFHGVWQVTQLLMGQRVGIRSQRGADHLGRGALQEAVPKQGFGHS